MAALQQWWSFEALYYQYEVLTLAGLLVFFMVASVIRLKLPKRVDHEKVQQAIQQLSQSRTSKERHHVR
jgi:hypothetical protein